jgi:hypothetical protein
MISTKCIALQAICGLGVALGVGAPGLAQQPVAAGVVVVWRAPAGCPTQADVLAEFSRLADSALQSDDGPPLRVNVVVEQRGARWLARLDMHGALDAERTLEGDSCQALADASAWLTAQTVRSLRAGDTGETLENGTQPESRSSVAAAVSVPAPMEPRSDPGGLPRKLEARALELGAAIWWDSGALPGSTVGLGLEVGWWLRGTRFALRPRVFLPRSATLPDRGFSATSATFVLAELPVQACYTWALGELELGPCGSLIVGLMWGASK